MPLPIIARKTSTFMPMDSWLNEPPAMAPLLFHGVGITRWIWFSPRSPRCAASCSTHQRQTFLPSLNPILRPQLEHFAIGSQYPKNDGTEYRGSRLSG